MEIVLLILEMENSVTLVQETTMEHVTVRTKDHVQPVLQRVMKLRSLDESVVME